MSKRLPKSFVRHGYRHEQVKRRLNVAIYIRLRPDGSGRHLEVVRIQKESKNRKLPSGGSVEEGTESYPRSSKWGLYGWTCRTLKGAEAKFAELVAKDEKRSRST